MTAFWTKLDELIEESEVVIDRPRGSAHPRFPEKVYPLDYGYLSGTLGGDGAGADVWLGTSGTRSLTGVLATVDVGKRDVELKLLLGCTQEEMDLARRFHEGARTGALLIERPG